MQIAIIFSLILGATHYWNERFSFKKNETKKIKTMSFVAGASLAYIFLFLLPDLYTAVSHINKWVFIFILLGFSSAHLFEKFFYQHIASSKRLFMHKELHFFIFFLYYFLIGIVLVNLIKSDLLKGTLFYVPALFYAVTSRVSFEEVHTHIREQKFFRILLSSAALLGVFASYFILEMSLLYHILLATITGAFFYIVIMDFLPKKSRGKPIYFLLGLILYTVAISLTWIF